MIKVGQGSSTDEIRNEETTGFVSIGRFSDEGEYIHRALAGPKRKESIIYPTFYQDYETGALQETFNTITLVPGTRSILDKLAAIERKVQHNNGIERDDIRAQFSRSYRYVWLILSRTQKDSEGKPYLGPWEYPARISKKLTEYNCAVDTKDKTKLRYGLFYTFDHIVKKYYDQKVMKKTGGNKQFATRYSIDIDPNCTPMAGKLPIDLLDAEYQKAHADKINELLTKVFTDEELELIEASEYDLDTLVKPVQSDEEIMEILEKFPINWNAKDPSGNDVFKYKEELFEEAQEFAGRLLENYSDTPALPQKSGESMADTETEAVKEEQAEVLTEDEDMEW